MGFVSVPTTDSAGRTTVRVRPGSAYTAYLERLDRDNGWMFLVLPAIERDNHPDFCRREEVIALPETLVRIRVLDSVLGAPVEGASIGVDNVGVRRKGHRLPDHGVVALKARTGANGEVEIPGLAPGLWRIGVRAGSMIQS